MAKLTRKTCIPFGLGGSASNFGQFGSKQAGTPQTSQDPAVIQALSAWLQGWTAAVVTGDKAGYIEDHNGLALVLQYMSSYLYQLGIPEWDSATTYYTGSVVQGAAGGASALQWFVSLQDNNTGNAPPASASNAFWQWANAPLPSTFGVGNGVKAGEAIAPNAGSPTYKVDAAYSTVSVQGSILSPFAQTFNCRTNGLNGLDTGAWTSGNLYALYLVCDATGTATCGTVASLNYTAPTVMPVGTTQYRRIGSLYADSNTTFKSFQMTGGIWTYNGASQFSITAQGAATNLRTYGVPPVATRAYFSGTLFSTGLSVGMTFGITGSSMPATTVMGVVQTSSGATQLTSVFDFAISSSQQIDIAWIDGAISMTLLVLGYYDPT